MTGRPMYPPPDFRWFFYAVVAVIVIIGGTQLDKFL